MTTTVLSQAPRGARLPGPVAGGSEAQQGAFLALVRDHASRMARRGAYDDAAHLLEAVSADDLRTHATLDLLARIRLQQGRADDARHLWTEILSTDPDHREANEALAALQRGSGPSRRLIAAAVGLLFVAAVGLGSAVIGNNDMEATAAGERPPEVAATSVSGRTPGMQPGATAPTIPQSEQPTAPCPALNAPDGWSCTMSGSGTQRFVPAEGLFTRGDRLEQEGAAALGELARTDVVASGAYQVRITGHANDVLPPPGLGMDNEEIAMRRAVAAYRVMRTATPGLDAARFDLRTAGADAPPFPHGSLGARSANRTVVIELVPRAVASEPLTGASNP